MFKVGNIVILNKKIEDLPLSGDSIYGISALKWKHLIDGKHLTVININEKNTNDWSGYRPKMGTISFKEVDNQWVFPIEWFYHVTYDLFKEEEDFLI